MIDSYFYLVEGRKIQDLKRYTVQNFAIIYNQVRPEEEELQRQPSHKNLRLSVYHACRVFWDGRLAELSSKTPERFYPATSESRCRISQANIRQRSGSTRKEEEEESKEPQVSGTP